VVVGFRAGRPIGVYLWRSVGLIQSPAFKVEPWSLHEVELDLDVLAQCESLFTLANGHIGWRANLDEGDPNGLAGSYLNGVYELRPIVYAETAYGFPEQDEVMLNVTNGKLIRLLVDDEPFDVRYGELHSHERNLDFRSGLLHRRADWSSPSGRRICLTSTRLVSLVQRSIAAIKYEVEAIDQSVRLVAQSELVVNEPPPASSGDPRDSDVLDSPWHSVSFGSDRTRAVLVHSTEFSKLMVAAAMDHLVDETTSTDIVGESFPDTGRVTISVNLEPGERLSLVKFVSYGWSAVRTREALRDQVDAALVAARDTGWDGLIAEQRNYLDKFWERADIEIEGDDEIQQAVRFALFHILQAGARTERRAIPAKGLTGTGYDGHAFWDSETYVLPVLSYTLPEAAARALSWRRDTLPLARDRAVQLGFKGAAFPWRTITGAECSAYWPAGTAAFHVDADIADAVIRYVHATSDSDFEKGAGAELLAETARLWHSIGHYDAHGGYRIDGVTGPDEYSPLADNNIYTNLMAQRNLRAAADVAERNPDRARELAIEESDIAAWRGAADAMVIPFDESLGVHAQSEGFTDHQPWDFATTTPEQYPLLLHFPYFDLYRKQVVKQADLVLAMYLRGDAFNPEQKKANFDYYEALTVRDSSLSACIQSVMAAEVGYPGLAYDYLGEAALMDLHDLEHNTRDGLHIASLAGTWIAIVAGLAGMREVGDSLGFAPHLPDGMRRLVVNLVFRSRRLRLEVTPETVRYQLVDGDPLELFHDAAAVTVATGHDALFEVARAASPQVPLAQPRQPVGRTPIHRVIGSLDDEQAKS